MRVAVVGGQVAPALSCMIVPCPAPRWFKLNASLEANLMSWPLTLVTAWMAFPCALLNIIRSPGRMGLLMPVMGVPGSTSADDPFGAMSSSGVWFSGRVLSAYRIVIASVGFPNIAGPTFAPVVMAGKAVHVGSSVRAVPVGPGRLMG